MRLVAGLFSALATLILAYAIAIFLYAVADQISGIPSGPLWDPSFRLSLRVVLLILGFIALIIPAFRSESPASQRGQAIFATAFFGVYVLLKISKLVDPDIPYRALFASVAPLWQSFIHTVTAAPPPH